MIFWLQQIAAAVILVASIAAVWHELKQMGVELPWRAWHRRRDLKVRNQLAEADARDRAPQKPPVTPDIKPRRPRSKEIIRASLDFLAGSRRRP